MPRRKAKDRWYFYGRVYNSMKGVRGGYDTTCQAMFAFDEQGLYDVSIYGKHRVGEDARPEFWWRRGVHGRGGWDTEKFDRLLRQVWAEEAWAAYHRDEGWFARAGARKWRVRRMPGHMPKLVALVLDAFTEAPECFEILRDYVEGDMWEGQ